MTDFLPTTPSSKLEWKWIRIPNYVDAPCPQCGGNTRASICFGMFIDGVMIECISQHCRQCRPDLVDLLWNP